MAQLLLLLWKNWLLHRRNLCVSVFEIILPVLFAILVLLARTIVDVDTFDKPIYYDQRSVVLSTDDFENDTVLGYVPQSSETDWVMESVLVMIENRTIQGNSTTNFTTKSFSSEDAAVEYFRLHEYEMRHLIVFDDVASTDPLLPRHLTFTVRPYTGDSDWNTGFAYPIFQTNEPRNDTDDLYRTRGVLYLQALVGEAITRYWLDKDGNVQDVHFGVYTKRMAYPPHTEDNMVFVLQNMLPLFIILSFILSVIINTKNLVHEKERKLKESMKLMGMTAMAHFLSWFITFVIILLPAIAIYALLMGTNIITSNGPVLFYTDGFVFFLFLLCYGLALISFCFMVSTFVQQANVAAGVAGVLFFACYFPFYFVRNDYSDMSKSAKLASCLLFNTAMSLGANCIGIYEGTGAGARFDNFYEPATVDDNLSLLECMIMLLVDSAIHFLLFWYLDNIRPGDYGVPKPYYFCFTKSYWCGGEDSSDFSFNSNKKNEKLFEKEPTERKVGIQISNLHKEFGPKVAVAGTSLNMYEGQITVLLGHNGAGKTTTMSMLTGLIPPTSGTAHINGHDIRKNITGVRSSLGLCPQHDILFDTLTVTEHLEFFAKLKGMTDNKRIKNEVLAMATEVGLQAKVNTQSQHLSGGQKRKLSVGIALIAGSKVVILDEPSSGMDPAARRQTWNVLQNARQGRTLVLSTHYMDEADLLGDRIAIMAEGVVKCCGSSMFLKKLYGAGYHLVVVKKPECNVDKLTSFIQSYISSTELETIINTEVTYLLPDDQSAKFANLFRELENRKSELNINSFGTSATTMEEVFLKVGEDGVDEEERQRNGRNGKPFDASYMNSAFANDYDSDSYSKYGTCCKNKVNVIEENSETESHTGNMDFNSNFRKKTGLSLEMARIKALFIKKAIHTWRNRTVTLVQLLLPVIFTIIGLAVDAARTSRTAQPALTFDLSPFGNTFIPYLPGNNSDERDFSHVYTTQFDSSKQTVEEIDPASGNFDNYTVKKAEELELSEYKRKLVIGMDFATPNDSETFAVIAYHNSQPYHAEPIAVNYLMNALLQYTLNDSFSLQSRIDPLPKDDSAQAESEYTENLSTASSVGFFIGFGMSFLTTLFIHFLIKERQVGAKHMQSVSGVGPAIYWLPTFLWDFVNYIVPSLLLIVVFAAYSQEAYLGDGRWALSVLVLVLYGWAILPFIYLFQFAFKSPPTGVVIAIMLNIVSGLVTTTAISVLQLPGLGTQDVAEGLDWIFKVIFPNYNMAQSFINIYTNYLTLQTCESLVPYCVFRPNPCCKDTCDQTDTCIKYEDDYTSMEMPGIGAHLLFMAIQGAFFFIIVLMIEYNIFQRIMYYFKATPSSEAGPGRLEQSAAQVEDSDVAAEKQRINDSLRARSPTPGQSTAAFDGSYRAIDENGHEVAQSMKQGSPDSLILANLYKCYGSFVAVDHICVGVPDQECFGLLGQNGAGKTTTFKMLTGDVMVSDGNAYLKGYDVRNNIKHVQSNMGYCPQFDALIDQMTGRETLFMYARLRGVPEDKISTVATGLIEMLMLEPHADKLAGTYSGGNKRKLSTAVALVGNPPFIMLDEPSSGMDPKARRQLWNVLSQVRASGRTLVLTSHSMEECDALCTRIAIMVNGRFVCLGSPQHLKNKFGEGYTLIVQLGALPDGNTAPIQPVINFVLEHFPGTKVFDDHQGYVHFQVPDATVKLADVFSLMESTKQNLNVEDYSVHQTTLEQVFLTFTRSQAGPPEVTSRGRKNFCCGS